MNRVTTWITVGSMLLEAGQATYDQIKAFIASLSHGLSEEELNAILSGLRDDAVRRAALAKLDQVQAANDEAAAAGDPLR